MRRWRWRSSPSRRRPRRPTPGMSWTWGCGAGNDSLKLLERLPGLDITLLDLSRPMLERAAGRVGPATTGRVTTVQGDIQDVALGDGRFDLVLAAAVLHHLRADRGWEAVFAAVSRALRPGGSVWVFHLVESSIPAAGGMMGGGTASTGRVQGLGVPGPHVRLRRAVGHAPPARGPTNSTCCARSGSPRSRCYTTRLLCGLRGVQGRSPGPPGLTQTRVESASTSAARRLRRPAGPAVRGRPAGSPPAPSGVCASCPRRGSLPPLPVAPPPVGQGQGESR